MSSKLKPLIKAHIAMNIALAGKDGITHGRLRSRFKRNHDAEFNEMMVVLFLGNALLYRNGRLFLNDSNDEIYKFLRQHSLK